MQIQQGLDVWVKWEGEIEDRSRHFSGMCWFSFCFPICFPITGVYSRLSLQS